MVFSSKTTPASSLVITYVGELGAGTAGLARLPAMQTGVTHKSKASTTKECKRIFLSKFSAGWTRFFEDSCSRGGSQEVLLLQSVASNLCQSNNEPDSSWHLPIDFSGWF